MAKNNALRLETTLERLTDAVEIFKLMTSSVPAEPNYSDEEMALVLSNRQKISEGMLEYREEIRAIFYTLRISGVKEEDFPEMIKHVRPQSILVTIDPKFPVGFETFAEWKARQA